MFRGSLLFPHPFVQHIARSFNPSSAVRVYLGLPPSTMTGTGEETRVVI
jgi:hypothetical protein